MKSLFGWLCLCLFVCGALATTVSLGRKPHTYGHGDHHPRKPGSVIPLDGSFVLLGEYYATVSVGTPPQYFNLSIDTGSSNIVLPSLSCTTCGNEPAFHPSASSTYSSIGCNSHTCKVCNTDGSTTNCLFGSAQCLGNTGYCGFGITYGGGATMVQGYWSKDKVCFGGICSQAIFGQLTAEFPSGAWSFGPVAGILGLASPFNACNPSCVTPVLDSYVEANLVNNLFAICLNPLNGGILDLGKTEPSRYSGTIQWAPQERERWYNIVLLDILVGGTSIGLPPFAYATTNDVIGTFVDSGTPVIVTGPLIYKAIQAGFLAQVGHLPGIAGNISLFSGACIPSSLIYPLLTQYPNLVFVVQSQNGPPIHLPVPASSYLVNLGLVTCLGMISDASIGVVLGDIFMENYYIVFDRANTRVGFAPVANCH